MTRTESHGSGAQAQRALRYLNEDQLKRPLSQLNTTAMQTLLGAVQRAGSLEEIEIVLRYQAARSREANRSEDGRYQPDLEKRLLKLLSDAGQGKSGARQQAEAAAEQLAMIARVHRIITAEKKDGRGAP